MTPRSPFPIQSKSLLCWAQTAVCRSSSLATRNSPRTPEPNTADAIDTVHTVHASVTPLATLATSTVFTESARSTLSTGSAVPAVAAEIASGTTGGVAVAFRATAAVELELLQFAVLDLLVVKQLLGFEEGHDVGKQSSRKVDDEE